MSKKYPFVSIVVPVYNGEKTIGRCIESLLNLDYPKDRYEIIVVDNGSKDRTREIVKKYPVTLLVENKIRSSYAARNKGIKHAKGEYIAFIDADEWADKKWLKEMVKHASFKNRILTGSVIPVVEKNTPWEWFDYYSQLNVANDAFIGCGNMMAEKQIFDFIGNFPEVASGGDIDFIKRCAKQKIEKKFVKTAQVFHRTRKSFKELVARGLRIGLGQQLRGEKIGIKNFLKTFFPGIRTYYSLYKTNKIKFYQIFGLSLANISFYWAMNLGRILGFFIVNIKGKKL